MFREIVTNFAAGKGLVLPAETEERVKRRALSACQEHLRKVLDLTRKVPQIIEHFIKNDKAKAKQLYNEIRVGEADVDTARRLVSQELAQIGAILLSREDFLRFTNLTGEIADFTEGIAFRIIQLMEHEWKVPASIKEELLKLSEAVLETLLKLREIIIVLSYGSTKALEKASEVEVAEQTVDELYRNLDIKLLNSKLEIPALLLLRDILQLLEDSADKAEDAADAARVLSFIM
jgi:predicted phosphate transport protein (TIGR00153 family)